ncbi:MAG: long-chain fatty acid--CoA ligase, partial [Halioglobus sp.]|nr:long-chain fatty acid--CoA ligase [Halioglobus sp.]
VAAVVQLATNVDNDTLAAHCRAALAGYKTPRRWHRVAQLPHNAAGKVDKPLLRSRYKEL